MNISPLKPALLWLLLLWQAAPQPGTLPARFRYQRGVELASGSGRSAESSQACAVLDAEVFAHAAPSLKDIRLYSGQTEIPYATTLSEPLQQESEDARILNLDVKSGHILFDVEMPSRAYTDVTLNLAAQDYIAEVKVSGGGRASGGKQTQLGTFTLFDLTTQRLSHSTQIPLPESTFAFLHMDLALTPVPDSASAAVSLELPAIVKGATVPPSREGQSIYNTTQRVMSLEQEGQESVATFKVPTRVPVERIAFALAPGYKGNFSRAVTIEARGTAEAGSGVSETSAFRPEDITGSILRVRKTEADHDLSAENLSVPVSIGSNMQQPAMVKVMIENGPEPPLPIAAVALQMRQRRICFDTRSALAPLTLYYGDPSLEAPAYSDPALDQAAASPRLAELEAESVNPDVVSALSVPRKARPNPVLRWVALLGCVCIFALLVIRRGHQRWH